MRSFLNLFAVILVLAGLSSCTKCSHKDKPVTPPWEQPPVNVVTVKKLSWRVVREMPHQGDRIYTQGFEIHDGILYESSGLYNKSSLKKIDLRTGAILLQKNIDDYFAEGLTVFNGYITLLSWREGKTFSYNLSDLSSKGISNIYNSEGWGLTNNDTLFIMSDGTDKLFFRDPLTFNLIRQVGVRYQGNPVLYLNELEYAGGLVYANVYGSSFIYAINTVSGNVVAELDLSSLLCATVKQQNEENVLNGIAFNPATRTFYITGKRCPLIYEIEITDKQPL